MFSVNDLFSKGAGGLDIYGISKEVSHSLCGRDSFHEMVNAQCHESRRQIAFRRQLRS